MLHPIRVVILTVLLSDSCFSQENEFRMLTSCTCVGQDLIFECTIHGDGGTYWQGSALEECSSGRILVRHSQHDAKRNTTAVCGTTGIVIGYPVAIVNMAYISRLTINMSQSLNGTNIECVTDHGRYIGSSDILLSTATSIPPPNNVSLYHVNKQHIVFTWSSSYQNCPMISYHINSTLCVNCPKETTLNTLVCNNTISPQQISCNLKIVVQPVICNGLRGTPSEPYTLLITIPRPPRIKVIPEYSGETSILKKIYIEFNNSEEVFSGDIVQVVNYTVTYSSFLSGRICGSTIIPVVSCESEICKTTFEISSSLCPSVFDIDITVYASNMFGDGPPSEIISISANNHFIDINFDLFASNVIKCNFINWKWLEKKSCKIDYGPRSSMQCNNNNFSLSGQSNLTTSNTVNLYLPSSSNYYEVVYCYRLMAYNGFTTIVVSGTFVACSPEKLSHDNSIVTSKVICGASYSMRGIENGFVCYSGTKVGSSAVYVCFDCGYNSLKYTKEPQSLFRTCGKQGQWNGTIPQCECTKPLHITRSNFGLIFGIYSGIVVLPLIALFVIFSISTAYLYNIKSKLKKRLKSYRDSEKIYEEIDQLPQPMVNTDTNIAYASCSHNIAVMESAS